LMPLFFIFYANCVLNILELLFAVENKCLSKSVSCSFAAGEFLLPPLCLLKSHTVLLSPRHFPAPYKHSHALSSGANIFW
jgi:hypothetical protein